MNTTVLKKNKLFSHTNAKVKKKKLLALQLFKHLSVHNTHTSYTSIKNVTMLKISLRKEYFHLWCNLLLLQSVLFTFISLHLQTGRRQSCKLYNSTSTRSMVYLNFRTKFISASFSEVFQD